MKCLFLIGILFLGVLWCKANEEELQDLNKNSNDPEDVLEEIKELFQKKCRKVGGEDAYKNLTRVLDGVKLCLGVQLPQNTDEIKELKDSSENSSEEKLCTEKRSKMRECFSDFVGVWEDCSEPDEKYLPNFVFDAIDGVLNYICADETGFTVKVFNSLECVFVLKEIGDMGKICSDKYKFLKPDNSDDIVIKKEELCEDLQTARTCAAGYVEEKCPGSEFKDIVIGIYDGINSACDKRHKRNIPLSLSLF